MHTIKLTYVVKSTCLKKILSPGSPLNIYILFFLFLCTGEDFQGIKPDFSLRPLDTQALAGSKVILFCGAYGLGSEMQAPAFVWLKDGKTIDFS